MTGIAGETVSELDGSEADDTALDSSDEDRDAVAQDVSPAVEQTRIENIISSMSRTQYFRLCIILFIYRMHILWISVVRPVFSSMAATMKDIMEGPLATM